MSFENSALVPTLIMRRIPDQIGPARFLWAPAKPFSKVAADPLCYRGIAHIMHHHKGGCLLSSWNISVSLPLLICESFSVYECLILVLEEHTRDSLSCLK